MRNLIFLVCLMTSYLADAAVVSYENNYAQWSQNVGAGISTIDFESIVATGSPVEISGGEFLFHPFSPKFSIIDGGGIYVGNPATGQTLTPTSGQNMLFPECNPSCEGIIRVDFEKDIIGLGAYFIDVEADFKTTGFSLIGGNVPEISFSSSQGQNASSFLGFVSDKPFSLVDIHFTTGPNIDGTLIDDLTYAPVPLPATALLLASGFFAFFRLSAGNRKHNK